MLQDVLYNEIEPYAADWLEALSARGCIPSGRVERRSVAELRAADLAGVKQFHTFAGIGVWAHALQLAGWPADREVWTGSCPCQPFSQAGKGGGFSDARHLWPEWFRLISERRPAAIFGEQVASPDGLKWLDVVFADLEDAGYAVGAADLCAAGVGAPHIRQRLYFHAYRLADANGRAGGQGGAFVRGRVDRGNAESRAGSGSSSSVGRLADDDDARFCEQRRAELSADGNAPLRHDVDGCGPLGGVGDDDDEGSQRHRESERQHGAPRRKSAQRHGATSGFWGPADWIFCRDGKWRPVEPGTFPLAHGATGRVGRLRAYGNALVAQAAATFVRAVM